MTGMAAAGFSVQGTAYNLWALAEAIFNNGAFRQVGELDHRGHGFQQRIKVGVLLMEDFAIGCTQHRKVGHGVSKQAFRRHC